MLEIKVDELDVKVKGNGSRDVMIADAALAVISISHHLSSEFDIPVKEAFARLVNTAESTINKFEVETVRFDSVVMPDLGNISKKKGDD